MADVKAHHMPDDLNGLDSKINTKAYFERILRERDAFEAERQLRMDERFEALEKALVLQATEYQRRLHDLNGEYQRDRQRQSNYVTSEKFEDNLKAESTARILALEGVKEKFDEYVKRYEVRQREIDLLLNAASASSETATRIAKEQADITRAEATAQSAATRAEGEERGRKSNRNMALGGLALTLFVFAANFIGPLVLR